ncbi:hypothetical protein RCH09_002136 [Actimicrobium sp. GrIS 1.19]|uniref:ankyrin repeat domain-containing protein n=1 Tax=Actimicrobium sp. GrIS 1.19 TaxID=3071708 RepID=UPI002E0AC250|nr:hypothetical protein [Actimicrobium sp. GrIS 1.19]
MTTSSRTPTEFARAAEGNWRLLLDPSRAAPQQANVAQADLSEFTPDEVGYLMRALRDSAAQTPVTTNVLTRALEGSPAFADAAGASPFDLEAAAEHLFRSDEESDSGDCPMPVHDISAASQPGRFEPPSSKRPRADERPSSDELARFLLTEEQVRPGQDARLPRAEPNVGSSRIATFAGQHSHRCGQPQQVATHDISAASQPGRFEPASSKRPRTGEPPSSDVLARFLLPEQQVRPGQGAAELSSAIAAYAERVARSPRAEPNVGSSRFATFAGQHSHRSGQPPQVSTRETLTQIVQLQEMWRATPDTSSARADQGADRPPGSSFVPPPRWEFSLPDRVRRTMPKVERARENLYKQLWRTLKARRVPFNDEHLLLMTKEQLTATLEAIQTLTERAGYRRDLPYQIVRALRTDDKNENFQKDFDAAFCLLEHLYGMHPTTAQVGEHQRAAFSTVVNGICVNSRLTPLRTAMNHTSEQTQLAAVTMLLRLGADPAQRSVDGLNEVPLQSAIRLEYPEVVTILLNHVASAGDLMAQANIPADVLNAPFLGASSAVFWAINTPEIGPRDDVLRALVNSGASLELRDPVSGDTPLQHAVRSGSVDMVRLLLQLGADTNSRTRGCVDIMTLASQSPNREAIEAALGAHLQTQTQPGV